MKRYVVNTEPVQVTRQKVTLVALELDPAEAILIGSLCGAVYGDEAVNKAAGAVYKALSKMGIPTYSGAFGEGIDASNLTRLQEDIIT